MAGWLTKPITRDEFVAWLLGLIHGGGLIGAVWWVW